jgi:multimeric flavodoxin WrbA
VKVVALHASPRRRGNSEALAKACLAGAAAAGHETDLVHLPDHVQGHLRDCRTCRSAAGSCTIPDSYEALLLERVVLADGLIYATPLWWYGAAGYLKTFVDRLFCFLADSYPRSEDVVRGLHGIRVGLLVSAEETYPGAILPLVAQVQELCRYLHQPFVGYVRGTGNTRAEVALDPDRPLEAAERLGSRLFEFTSTDYRVDTPRPNAVWGRPLSGD